MSVSASKKLIVSIITACFVAGTMGAAANAEVTMDMGPMEVIRFNPWAKLQAVPISQPTQWTQEEVRPALPTRKMIKGRANVSPGFQDEIVRALAKLPPATVNALERSGYKLSLSKTVTQAVPAARQQQVRGYEKHATWDSVYGMFNRTTREVVMAEFAEGNAGSAKGLVTLNNETRRQGILRHEIGHAVDQYLGNFSHTPEFKRLYQRGLASVSKPEEKVLFYYAQPGDAGLEETFAELFACMNETACDKNSDMLLRNHFGELMNLIRINVATIK